MTDILSEIVAHKRVELEEQKRMVSQAQLENALDAVFVPRRSMKEALMRSPNGIISEFKRRSPSKGWIKQNACPTEIVPSYEKAGAAAVSILTDEKFFGGTLRDIRSVCALVNIPILRKDFIIDSYQLYQAKMVGADAVLLIASCLSLEVCANLTKEAHELGLEVLLEIHSEHELDYVSIPADMIGVNNRNLGTFITDVNNSFRMARVLGQDRVLVSESGISNPETIQMLRTVGFNGFLVGESFMKTSDPAATLNDFIAACTGENK